MIIKCAVIFFLLQAFLVERSTSRHLSLFHLSEGLPGKSPIVDATKRGSKRRRRCLSTTLSLLWPQVVGPVEQGIIKENDYSEVPKTILEYRLDLLRKKAAEEEESRLMVRDYLKKLTEAQDDFYGYHHRVKLINKQRLPEWFARVVELCLAKVQQCKSCGSPQGTKEPSPFENCLWNYPKDKRLQI